MKLDKNITAIITGGASGLGQATTRLLASKGAFVIIADMNHQKGQKLANEINTIQKQQLVQFYKTDVTNEQNVQQLFEYTVTKYKRIDIVVNSAGIYFVGAFLKNGKVASTTVLEKVLRINVVGTFNVVKYSALYMSKQELINEQRGLIINVTSIAAFQGPLGHVIYSASKGAILGMNQPLSRDLGKLKIRVMSIAPGVFQTPMMEQFVQKFTQQSIIDIKNNTPLGRLGKPLEFAKAVVAIAQNKFANGTTWRVDGGILNKL